MAGRGPAPKSADRPHGRPTEAAGIAVDLELGSSPVKAPRLPGSTKLSRETRAWYRTWTQAPQASQFTVTDWQRLHMLAPLVDAYYAKPTAQLLGEIRLNEAKLGATAEDRLRLRWRVMGPKVAGAAAAEAEPARRSSSRARPDPRLRLVDDGASEGER